MYSTHSLHRHPACHMKTRLLPLLLLLLAPAPARACSIPVFRYALERWELAPYEITVYYEKQLPGDLNDALKKLQAGISTANVKITRVDVSREMDAHHAKLWNHQGGQKSLPWLSARSSEAEADLPDAWSSPLTVDNLRRLIDSPARRQMVEHLSSGTTAVFLLLPGADEAANAKAAVLLEKELVRLAKLVELPELKPQDKLKTDVPLKIEFVTLRLNRDNPAEQAFIQCLLHSEQRLDKVRGPIVFPVFGRGRLLCSIFGEDLSEDNLRGVVQFICGECQCTLKELNLGSDLLLAADWPAVLKHAGPPRPPSIQVSAAASEPAGDPSARLPTANANLVVPPSAPAPVASPQSGECCLLGMTRQFWLLAATAGAGVLVLATGIWVFVKKN
jgi:hypothetical protein